MSTSVPITTSAVTVTDNGSTVAVSVASSAVSVDVGTTGPQGATGPGVAAGGTTGQYLRKSSGTNYDTAWDTLTSADVDGLDSALAGKLDSSTAATTYTALTALPYSAVVPAIVQTNAANATVGAFTQEYFAASLFNARAFAGTGQDGYMEWTFFVAAGTYTLRTVWRAATNGGIASISIDGGAALGTTIDTYAAANASNNITDITGIALTAGRHTIRYTGATKNASSTAFAINLHGFSLTRTGA